MSHREDIVQQALALSAEDRAYVVTVLQTSLAQCAESDEPAESELLQELQRRSAAWRDGTASAKPAAEVLAELRQRQSRESAT